MLPPRREDSRRTLTLAAYFSQAFLVPYTLVLLVIGIPLFLLELYVGQNLQIAATYAWPKYHPAFGGLGISGTLATFFVALYYNVIVAWGACEPHTASLSLFHL